MGGEKKLLKAERKGKKKGRGQKTRQKVQNNRGGKSHTGLGGKKTAKKKKNGLLTNASTGRKRILG